MKLHLKCVLAGLSLLVIQTTVASGALIDITRPGDPIERVDGFNQGDGNAGPPPGAETVVEAINDIGQKYLNFLDLSSGLSVTPSANPGNNPVVGLRLYTANDAVPRDPASYQFFGSNGTLTDGPWTAISSGNLSLPDARNPGGNSVTIPPLGNPAAAHQEVLFDNTDTYDHYRLVFPTLKDADAANSMQIAEVEMLVVPEPTGIALGLFALLGVICGTRRTER